LIDTGSANVFGISLQGGRNVILTADVTTTASSANTREKVFTNAAVGSDSNCVELGRIVADFDDTGNSGGEDFWTVQTGRGDINISSNLAKMERGTFIF